MGQSWGHRIAKLIGAGEPKLTNTGNCDVRHQIWIRACSATGCNGPREFIVEWDYVTGSRGRASSQTRLYCFEHARRWCDRHGIDMAKAPKINYADWASPRVHVDRSGFAMAASRGNNV